MLPVGCVFDNLEVSLEKDLLKLTKKFSSNLRRLRLAKKLTQEDMTSYGFNYRHYQKLESGSHIPSLMTILKLSKIMGVQAKDLLE